MEEIWKDVVWYEWLYRVSSFGNVYSIKRKMFLKKNAGYNPYYRLRVYKDGKWEANSFHRLVAIAFIPNPENKPQVNHKDWNKLNNKLENLEWVTALENNQHWTATWLIDRTRVSKPVLQFTLDWTFIREWRWPNFAKYELWISRQSIWKCCNWENHTAGWFIWRYKNPPRELASRHWFQLTKI